MHSMDQITIAQKTNGNSYVNTLLPPSDGPEALGELKRLLEHALSRRGQGFFSDDPVVVQVGGTVVEVTDDEGVEQVLNAAS